jgi:hypothetical protein
LPLLSVSGRMHLRFAHRACCLVSLAGEHGDIIPAALSPAATTACLKLEGGLYASNVVLGRLIDVVTPEVDALIKELVLVAADAATNHTSEGHVWLAGCLTSKSSMCSWLLSLSCAAAQRVCFSCCRWLGTGAHHISVQQQPLLEHRNLPSCACMAITGGNCLTWRSSLGLVCPRCVLTTSCPGCARTCARRDSQAGWHSPYADGRAARLAGSQPAVPAPGADRRRFFPALPR